MNDEQLLALWNLVKSTRPDLVSQAEKAYGGRIDTPEDIDGAFWFEEEEDWVTGHVISNESVLFRWQANSWTEVSR